MEIKGGQKMQDALARISEASKTASLVKVGFLAGATYPSVPKKELRGIYKRTGRSRRMGGAVTGASGGLPVAAVAAFQNFGTGKIPPRPFFSNMVKDKSPEWGLALALQLKKANYDAAKALNVLGAGIAGQLRQAIRDTNSPPLAESTIRQKGFSKPLISTSHMINSVDHEVI